MSDDEQQEHQEHPDDELEAMRTWFDMFDINKDGHICATELETVLQHMGLNPTTEEIDAIMAEADKNKDSKVTYEEFSEIFNNNGKGVDATAQLEQAWDVLDRNGNGYLERDELSMCLKKNLDIDLDDGHLDVFLDAMDTNNDGRVDKQEFIKAIKSGSI